MQSAAQLLQATSCQLSWCIACGLLMQPSSRPTPPHCRASPNVQGVAARHPARALQVAQVVGGVRQVGHLHCFGRLVAADGGRVMLLAGTAGFRSQPANLNHTTWHSTAPPAAQGITYSPLPRHISRCHNQPARLTTRKVAWKAPAWRRSGVTSAARIVPSNACHAGESERGSSHTQCKTWGRRSWSHAMHAAQATTSPTSMAGSIMHH